MSQSFSKNTPSTAEDTEVFIFPTSFAQQRLWFLNQLLPGNPIYNISAALRLTGSLNITALEQAFNEIVRRHETLRTTFLMVEGQPMQAIAPSLSIPLSVIDLRHFSIIERETQAKRLANEEAQRPFHLSIGPLMRVTLLKWDETEHVLLLNLHHIVADGWSISILVRELSVLYTIACEDAPWHTSTPLPELPIQYADFAEWQRQWLQEPGANGLSPLQTQLTYWKKQLNGISLLNLPTDRLRPKIPSYKGAQQFLQIPKSLSKALEELSCREGVTLFMTLLAAFQTLLYRYTQQEDIVVGSPIANRNRTHLEGLIGFFVNNLVLRTDFSGNPTFQELLARVREVTLEAYAHQDCTFEKLVEELHPERDLSRHPLFQVVFSLQNTPVEMLELPGLTLSLLEFDSKTAKLDLEFHLWQDLENLKGQIIYSTDLFDDSTITRMLGHFQTLLEGIVTAPQQKLSDLPLLTQTELHQFLVNFGTAACSRRTQINNHFYPRPSATGCGSETKILQCFHQLFETQAKQTPNTVAVVFEKQELTYHELNSRANQLAHYLQKRGVVPEVLVGLCLERSIDMIVGLLAILKAGGAYLPLDPTYPLERLKFMLEDARISVLLTTSEISDRQLTNNIPIVVYLDQDWETIAQHSQENPTTSVKSNNLAYVIYTSGSTGKPKGVPIEHRGVYNLVQAQIETFNLQPGDRILQFASLSFDASVFEIVMALGTGGTLCLANKESLLPGQSLIELLQKQEITHVTLPPAVLAILPKAELPALQTIICAGELCTSEIVKRWWQPNRKLFNAYGPTEATVWSTIAEITIPSDKPPIGCPIANTQVYILDKHLQPVPIGVTGELYIGGASLARGYLNLPHQTAERFIPNPLLPTPYPLSPIFKTGDLARYRSDGNIEFLGRIDNQVKIRGFRIELQEIEMVLTQHNAVQEAVVIVKENVSGDKWLVAYVVPERKYRPTTIEIQSFLREKLPEYMIPSAFVLLNSFPLTPSGKLDHRALPALDNLTEFSANTAFVPPRTPVEIQLAKIWAKTLNLQSISIQDNFFDLGGNSLLAVRLMEDIHQEFQRNLPLSFLFLNPTIQKLAKFLVQEQYTQPWSPLVAIQPDGSNPPFFCVHPIFGTIFPYYELAYHLGKNQPFYGLQPVGLDGESPPLKHIEDMAAYYIEALSTVQPRGPYFLGGWSFGGLVAFEMAQQLYKAGHEVALLAVLDTTAPVFGFQPSMGDSVNFLFSIGARYIWSFLFDYLYLIVPSQQVDRFIHRVPYLNQITDWMRTNLLSPFNFKELSLSNLITQESKSQILRELTLRPMMNVFRANSQATLSYIPQLYPNQVTLFKSGVQSTTAHQDSSLGWEQLALGGVEVHQIPGNHLTMLRKPHVRVLAEQLQICIDRAIGNC
ncbi:amino acid adenylation domain-containing protein [Scytonema sp. UIC 10036]|uniref:non-ribosomal peptide synthetase n=1 Tax=Scytonema sp. UIC 10036 TaxID=2304196 RepID=UPI0012DABAC1|nr:non-ribosomal peptide synthetase [Scytonema sp. UIC 10036]MUH00250.1 amino acid adenylation domain-containing protein [Scytonema sp. UIC 10036]